MSEETETEKVTINVSDFEEGLIPKFFVDDWIRNESKAKRFRTKNGYDPIADMKSFEKVNKWRFGIWILFVILYILSLVCLVTVTPGSTVVGSVSVCSVLMGTLLYTWPKKEGNNGWEFFSALQEFFDVFEIEPSKALGRLSDEAFAAYVIDDLKKAARETHYESGFKKVAERDVFDTMYKKALEFKFCADSQSSYFPPKGT